jgi:hypothetical protein
MKYKIKKGLIYERKGKKITIFDPDKSTIMELNETAIFILNQIKKNLDIKKIINILAKEYDMKETELYKDVNIFLKDLKKNKIIFESK